VVWRTRRAQGFAGRLTGDPQPPCQSPCRRSAHVNRLQEEQSVLGNIAEARSGEAGTQTPGANGPHFTKIFVDAPQGVILGH